ncbi:MAG: glutamyl-tRNA reductase [Candidatus Rokubacteria bacterium]|nr:glutamyl-tRNA reductase [Candidatus Rokubacteria bacterium]
MATLFVSGLNHRTAPIELREQLALEEDKLREVLASAHATGCLAEAMILSTCNRVEVYGLADVPSEARRIAFGLLCQQRGVEPTSLDPLVYTKTDAEAIHHCFRVASSLDSMVLGEPQILGQVKEAFNLAQHCGTMGPVLHGLLTQAFAVAKRVRTDTDVARHAVSVSFAAIELAKKIFGGLQGKSVLLIGAGKMGELAARHLVDQGVFPLYVANRTWSRALELCRALPGTPVPFEECREVLGRVDIVISSTGAAEPIVRKEDVLHALHARRSRPLFFIDIGVPRDVEPGVNDLDNVFCYDIDDLRQVVEANLRERLREAQKAEALVEREVDKFLSRLKALEVVPTIVSLREKIEAIRQGEVAKALARLHDPSPETRAAIEALSSAIVNKILHGPTVKLRETSQSGRGRRWAVLVSELFGLRGRGEDA